MKNIKDRIFEQVDIQIRCVLERKIDDCVFVSVRNKVSNEVESQIWNRVRNDLWNQVCLHIIEKSYKWGIK
jgi:hypothetical protein